MHFVKLKQKEKEKTLSKISEFWNSIPKSIHCFSKCFNHSDMNWNIILIKIFKQTQFLTLFFSRNNLQNPNFGSPLTSTRRHDFTFHVFQGINGHFFVVMNTLSLTDEKQVAHTAWTPILSSRLLLNFSLSRQDHTNVWTCVCMLCCEALTINVTRDFPFTSELGQIWSSWLLTDQGPYCPAVHIPTGHIYRSQLEREQVRLLTHATRFLGQCSPGAQQQLSGIQSTQSTFTVTEE